MFVDVMFVDVMFDLALIYIYLKKLTINLVFGILVGNIIILIIFYSYNKISKLHNTDIRSLEKGRLV